MSIRNRVVQLARKFQLRNQVQAIIADKSKFSGRDLIMTGVGLKTTSCKSCSWLHGQIDTEIKNRELTWNSY